ncbi:MAG: hypothetical protein M2R45_00326 [Verrucomicrobia subdivision 3 bacterium]|nr:hypothetical protein [Limisphaerales bacterium]MCS1412915.1 hypothetical protein [Limisphaerales bacterium]
MADEYTILILLHQVRPKNNDDEAEKEEQVLSPELKWPLCGSHAVSSGCRSIFLLTLFGRSDWLETRYSYYLSRTPLLHSTPSAVHGLMHPINIVSKPVRILPGFRLVALLVQHVNVDRGDLRRDDRVVVSLGV